MERGLHLKFVSGLLRNISECYLLLHGRFPFLSILPNGSKRRNANRTKGKKHGLSMEGQQISVMPLKVYQVIVNRHEEMYSNRRSRAHGLQARSTS